MDTMSLCRCGSHEARHSVSQQPPQELLLFPIQDPGPYMSFGCQNILLLPCTCLPGCHIILRACLYFLTTLNIFLGTTYYIPSVNGLKSYLQT